MNRWRLSVVLAVAVVGLGWAQGDTAWADWGWEWDSYTFDTDTETDPEDCEGVDADTGNLPSDGGWVKAVLFVLGCIDEEHDSHRAYAVQNFEAEFLLTCDDPEEDEPGSGRCEAYGSRSFTDYFNEPSEGSTVGSWRVTMPTMQQGNLQCSHQGGIVQTKTAEADWEVGADGQGIQDEDYAVLEWGLDAEVHEDGGNPIVESAEEYHETDVDNIDIQISGP